MLDKLVIVLIVAVSISLVAYGLFFKNFVLNVLKGILGGLIGATLNEFLQYFSGYRFPSLALTSIFFFPGLSYAQQFLA